MSARRLLLPLALVASLALIALGCASSMQDQVSKQGVADLQCARPLVTPWIEDGDRYRVTGCGRQKEYACRLESAGAVCVASSDVTLAPPRAPGTKGITEGARVDLALAGFSAGVLACRPGATEITVPEWVVVDGNAKEYAERLSFGVASGLTSKGAPLTPSEVSCVLGVVKPFSQRFGSTSLAGAYTFSATSPLTVLPDLQAKSPSALPSAVAAPQADAGDASPAADTRLEAAVRALIDANATTIAACVDKRPIAVEASYAPDGAVRLTLRGDLRGTPVERCVVSALPDLHVATDGRAGTVVHLVR
jgi:hypothetical protein